MNTNPLDLTGKVVVVTGGNAGIGFGFARGIARAGGDVVIWGRRKDKNDEAVRELKQFGTKVIAQEVDVADEQQVVVAMKEAVKIMGRVDGAIANAGIMNHAKSFLELSGEQYHGLLSVNQHGAMYVAREAARHMKERFDAGDPGGSIVFCASLSALTGSAGMQHYNAAKGAMASMARGIAVDLGVYGIRCNTVCPGYTVSETVKDQGPDSPLGGQVRERTPIPRFGTIEDFEGIGVYFMCDASRFHTGDLVKIDGGWMANAGKANIAKLSERD
ncbi:SDR family oxidoreductase [Aestuariicella hydrocarbonica]|uniref:SDR family oxidoreductase n=1 Tax=Pseudomaricurvus hydrocarbonicus TaxID=1470433 RepID=A0A9E5MKP8_9GAMM|nr:SDR family oxidoreductase [Aestuariicella hydrocarbonica]NHO65662.1 SDR family oxidoreductase [Aestuariicella hydrocarbonica]